MWMGMHLKVHMMNIQHSFNLFIPWGITEKNLNAIQVTLSKLNLFLGFVTRSVDISGFWNFFTILSSKLLSKFRDTCN